MQCRSYCNHCTSVCMPCFVVIIVFVPIIVLVEVFSNCIVCFVGDFVLKFSESLSYFVCFVVTCLVVCISCCVLLLCFVIINILSIMSRFYPYSWPKYSIVFSKLL